MQPGGVGGVHLHRGDLQRGAGDESGQAAADPAVAVAHPGWAVVAVRVADAPIKVVRGAGEDQGVEVDLSQHRPPAGAEHSVYFPERASGVGQAF
jgi:hypothetical protein